MDAHRVMGGTQEGTGLRKALRRWRDRWRVSSSSSSRNSIMSAPTTRPPTNTSSIVPTSASTPLRLSPLPGSTYPCEAALFNPTTETIIHSPADPRNRPAESNTSSPSGTLKKLPPLSRRSTAPADYLTNLASSGQFPNNVDERPMGMVTTIVAGNANGSLRKRRPSRFRLSISKRGATEPPALNSPSMGSFFDRSSSRATQRFDAVEETGELVVRKRADTKISDPETLVEEVMQKGNEERRETPEDGEKETQNGEIDQEIWMDAREQLTPRSPLGDGTQSNIRVVEVRA